MASSIWQEKIARLLSEQALTQGTLAEKLGITPRTLSDFMRDDGREPTGAVAKLIDVYLGESGDSSSLRPGLNLIAIHRDYVMRGTDKGNPVETVSELSKAVGSGLYCGQENIQKFRDEFHYVTLAPSGEGGWALEDGLRQRKIHPHFLPGSIESSLSALDSYFAATVMAQVARSSLSGLARVIIAADPLKFWPLAYEIQSFANVSVAFVLESNDADQGNQLRKVLDATGISSIVVGGRHLGKIHSKKAGFGFINIDFEGAKEGEIRKFFFSWNDMKKASGGFSEIDFDQLHEGDQVSFTLGENHMGPCATDVALVSPINKEPNPASSLVIHNYAEDAILLKKVISEAISSCADASGWALLSTVGSRIGFVLCPDYRQRLDKLGFRNLKDFIKPDTDFEIAGSHGQQQVRIKRA